MESIHHIKSRIKTVKNVGQITKAMELVAATKMRKAQEIALRSRPYAYGALELLHNITTQEHIESVFARERELKTTLVVIVASDKGLTGAFNTQVLKSADAFFAYDMSIERKPHAYKILPIGKKALQYALKNKFDVPAHHAGAGDYTTPDECAHITSQITKGFLAGSWDRVIVISTHFRTTLRQDVLVRQLLPASMDEIKKTIEEIIPEHGRHSASIRHPQAEAASTIEYILEPSARALIDSLMPHLISMQLYHIILEANASEHSSRRVAMKTASDNADELSGDLTLIYNKARQANITTELIEITSTQQAL